ncbi:MAG: MBL fold metallo-hydrolase [Rubrivivax sp.]|jgi:glyoxylase-like metal-dependent hydrolase (beta-lactamase superfamily II)
MRPPTPNPLAGPYDGDSTRQQARRSLLRLATLAAMGAVGLSPPVQRTARATGDFIRGPAVPDHPLLRLSPRVAMVFADDGFPTPENRGMMANVVFVVTSAGVVVLDTGASVQIGEMALRRLKTVTDRPVVAVVNSHAHGDHFLGNDAFVQAYGASLPIHALPAARRQIEGVAGSGWRSAMERWTQGATLGTRVVAPTHDATPGGVLRVGDTTLRFHHHGPAHTDADLCVEVVEDRVLYVGDVVMNGRIANMDDGNYKGTLKTIDALVRDLPGALWVPGHGPASRDLPIVQRAFFAGLYENCLAAVKAGEDEAAARRRVLADPRVSVHAGRMQGWDNNIGKYISLAYLEAEKDAF